MKKLILEFEEYLRQEEKSNITIEKYLRDVEKFSRFVGSKDVTKEIVIEYKKSLIESGYATRSINSMWRNADNCVNLAGVSSIERCQTQSKNRSMSGVTRGIL